MKSIYIIGFMGSGKSTIAMEMAKRLQLTVQDTDQLIEQRYGRSIKQIFDIEGEFKFRDYEHEILRETQTDNCIISTGGGIVEQKRNTDWLEGKQVIYLQTSWDRIVKRLQMDTDRPIWQDKKRDKQQLLINREPKYLAAATYVIETDNKKIKTIVKEITTVLKQS